MSIWATKWAYEQDVTPSGTKFVLVALADFADAEGHCYPSQKRLAKMTCQSERSVRDHVLALEEAGFLRREKRVNKDGTRATDEFFLNGPREAFDPAADFAAGGSLHRQLSPKPPATLSTQPPAKSAAKPLVLEPSREPSISPPQSPIAASPPSRGPQPIDLFLAAYPEGHRGSRRELERAWAAAGEMPPIGRLIASLSKWIASYDWTKEGGRWIPNASRFIAERKYMQEPRPAPGNAQQPVRDWTEQLHNSSETTFIWGGADAGPPRRGL